MIHPNSRRPNLPSNLLICRVCGKSIHAFGHEPPPLGPICYGCLVTEAERLQAANAELLAALHMVRNFGGKGETDDGMSVSFYVENAIANAEPKGPTP